MKILSRTRYTITVQRNRSYFVAAPNGKKRFVKPDTRPGQKLYLVGLAGKLHYVGITNRPMSARISMGLKAKGKNGYHGYAWKSIRKPMTLDVITWSDGKTIRKDIEAIEAEVA
ncbi:MAG: hypothetical protein WBO04_13540, partial [Steroidobacteraceae bacterium]